VVLVVAVMVQTIHKMELVVQQIQVLVEVVAQADTQQEQAVQE
jgi:hypothetical protein